MTSDNIRKKFLDFFTSKGHSVIASDSLVPKDDPTVLFTTAGMQQFKHQFLGNIDSYTRAASSQKCLRTDDLDQVGKTDFHHTFFEMLGNFSFGDYFKKEAIEWAWEFLTKELKINPDKLWVSVYKDDSEAEKIWLKHIKIPSDRLIKLGDHSNFWPADAKEKGPNGPCGPCSEIFYDYGQNKNCSKGSKCDPSCDCGRFSEVWNLVFTQFERKECGVLEPLPNKNIDTGMGLERLTAVIQGKKSNYETDLFAPIINEIEAVIEKGKSQIEKKNKFIIADHMRAIVFGLSDGIFPSNEGRGYVLKKLIIDITDIILNSGISKPQIYKLVDIICKIMKNSYPDLDKKTNDIKDIIKNIEESYIKVRKERIPELKNQLISVKSPQELGNIIFVYRDTYGLTVQTIKNTMDELNDSIKLNKSEIDSSWEEFDKLMKAQQEKSRASSKMTGDVFVNTGLELGLPKTEFLGHKKYQATSTILKLFKDNKKIDEAKEGDQIKIALDKTPFYAESGGQVGDTGFIKKDSALIKITDTQKVDEIFIHIGIVKKGSFRYNDLVQAEIDVDRRIAVMRNHTATHLLQSALRDVIGTHVQQQGSYVAEDRLRFDFTHHKALSKEQLLTVEKRVNELILTCNTVTKEYTNIEEAKERGALAFFAEKYGEVVRVVSIGDLSKEFCGGTHLESTGQIGLFKIISESAIAQGIRRIEAKTGINALKYIIDEEKQLENIANVLKSPLSEVVYRVKTQTKKLKQMEKDIEVYRFEAIKNSLDKIIDQSEKLNGTMIINHSFDDINMNILRKVCDLLKTKFKSSIVLLGSQTMEAASILLSVSNDLVEKGIKANEIIKDIAPLINGRGGGRPQLAQAGSKEIGKVKQAIQKAKSIIKEKIKL